MMTRFHGLILIAFSVCVGCQGSTDASSSPRGTSTVIPSASRASTEDRVRKIVSEQMNVPIENLTSQTSLADLNADELDFVELIMELEDAFSITISEDKAEQLQGGKQDFKRVTIQKLSELVDELAQTPASKPDKAEQSRGKPGRI